MKNNYLMYFLQVQSFIVLFFIVSPLVGQEHKEKIPAPETWAQMSPEAGMVDLYSGTAGAIIPLWRYEDPDFTIPVDLVYYSGGFRPTDSGQGFGVGWELRMGGIITREVHGIPDDKDVGHRYLKGPVQHFYGFYHEHSFNGYRGEQDQRGIYPTLEDCNYFWRVYNGYKNSSGWNPKTVEFARDVFHFRFGEYDGSFVLDYNGQVKVFNSNSPHGEFKFDLSRFIPPTNSNDRSQITIITGDGTRHTFEARYENDTYYLGLNPYSGVSVSTPYNLTWTLKETRSPNGRVVSFSYRDIAENTYAKLRFSKKLEIKNMNYSYKDTYHTQYPCRWENPRNDIYVRPLPRINSMSVNGSKCLEFIYNSTNTHVVEIRNELTNQTYQFSYSNRGKFSLLKQVSFSSGEKYSMEYQNDNSAAGSPLIHELDHWGYYNGKSKSNTLPASMSGKNNLEFTQNQDNNPVFEKSSYFMLKKITYPTKGYTTFTYEPHKYSKLMRQNSGTAYKLLLSATPVTEAGGVRVSRIVNYSSPVDSTWVDYEYGDATNQGNLLFIPWYKKVIPVCMQCPHEGINPPSYVLTETTNFDFQPSNTGPHVEYPVVTEKRSDGSIVKHFFSCSETYPNTTEYTLNGQLNLSEPPCFMAPHGYMNETLNDGKHDINHNDWGWLPIGNERVLPINALSRSSLRGKPIRMEMYNKEGSKVQEEVFNYNYKLNYIEGVDRGLWCFTPYSILVARENNVERVVTQHLASGQLSMRDSLIYNQHGELVRHSRTRSDGSILAENTLHVKDLAANERSAIHNSMLALNIVNIPLKTYVEGFTPGNNARRLLQGSKNEFMVLGNNTTNVVVSEQKSTKLLQPVASNGFGFDSYLDTDMLYTYHAKGRVQAVTNAGGQVTTYVWGYSFREVVAEVVNATPAEVETALGNKMLGSINDASSLDSVKIAALNGLRAALPAARVTTWVYKPHVGLLSVTDPSGRTIYHEYDENNRLIRKKDAQGNILEEYEYGLNLE